METKKLGFGLMRLPLKNPEDRESIDMELVAEMVDLYLKRGFTYFDTAYVYHNGRSEAAARKALVERHPRENFLLADKMPPWPVKTSGDYPKIFDEQLARCGVTFFDYYLLHSVCDKVYQDTLRLGGFDFMRRLKAEGRARHIGFSFHDSPELLDQVLREQPDMEFVQLQINYLDWDHLTVRARECYETAVKHGKPVIVMEPVKGGSLAQVVPEAEKLLRRRGFPAQSPAAWAIRYAASLEGVLLALSGMSTLEQVEENTGFMENFVPLTPAEEKVLHEAAAVIRGSIAIPCTGCRYCVDGCPQKISIPDYFALYNDQKQFGLKPMHATYYRNLIRRHGKAADCVACKQCEAHCPQHLPVAALMSEVSQVFDKK